MSLTNHLPDGWSAATLADVGVWSSGGTPSKKRPEYHGGDIPWVLTGDLDDGPLIEIPNSITCAGLENSSAKLFPDGTLLMAMYGATIGKLAVLRHEAATNQACAALLPSKANQNSLKYVYYFLLAKREGFKKAGKGGAQPNISQTVIKETPIPVAPLNEQQRIVEKIETLFARLDKGEEAVRDVQKLLTRYRQSVLKSAVTGQLTADWRAQRKDQLEQGDNLLARILETRHENWDGRGKYKDPLEPEIGQFSDLPEGWTWASVDQVSSHFGNGLSKKPVLEENEFPILRISAARAMKVSVDDLRYYDPSEGENIDRFWVKTGDLLFTRYNGSARLVGVCGQMREEQSVLHPDKLIKARPIELPDLSTDFLELAWNCGVTRQHIAKNIKTTAGQQGVAGSDIKTAPFPLPSGPEQIEIATRVWDVFGRTDAMANWCETELKRSASLRQSILKDAFAGKLVPQDPTDEPASALLARIAAEKPTAKKTRRKTSA